MTVHHRELASGRWRQLTFVEQMANIGSEVERCLNWRDRKNAEYSEKAFVRALELIDLTLDANRQGPRLREVARVREVFADFYDGPNFFNSTSEQWRKYFFAFGCAARRNR
jgi:hypothetical protein